MLWTRGVAARATLSYLDRRGIDAKPALIGAGISRRQLSRDDIFLPVASQYRFLELAARQRRMTNSSDCTSRQRWTYGPLAFFSTLPGRRQRSPKRSKTWRVIAEPQMRLSSSRSRDKRIR